jgi:hypothetical protein
MTTTIEKKESIRAELEATRTAYHALVAMVNETAWTQKSTGSRRNLAQVLAHITAYLTVILPMTVSNARAGKNMPDLPGFIAHPLNYLFSIMHARDKTLQNIGSAYDKVHNGALQLLDSIKDDEWELRTNMPAGRLSIEEIFRHHTKHFAQHATEVRKTVGKQIVVL